MEPVRGQSNDHISGSQRSGPGNFAAFGDTDREAGEVILALLIQAGHLRGLAADQAGARESTTSRDPFNDRRRDSGVKFTATDIVKEKQRARVMTDDVIDAHRDQIDPDRIMAAGGEGDLEFGPDAVGAGDEYRFSQFRCAVESDDRAEAADAAEYVRAQRRTRELAKQWHQPFFQLNIHAGGFVGEPCHGSQLIRRASAVARHADLFSEYTVSPSR